MAEAPEFRLSMLARFKTLEIVLLEIRIDIPADTPSWNELPLGVTVCTLMPCWRTVSRVLPEMLAWRADSTRMPWLSKMRLPVMLRSRRTPQLS